MADKDMKWKTLSQKYLIEKPWLTARVDKVQLPTGVIIDESPNVLCSISATVLWISKLPII